MNQLREATDYPRIWLWLMGDCPVPGGFYSEDPERPFCPGASVDQLVDQGVLHDGCRKTFRRDKGGVPGGRSPLPVSKCSTVSTMCSTTMGPALYPSLVTWPTRNRAAPWSLAQSIGSWAQSLI